MSTPKQHIAYDSNPFTVGLTAIKKVFAVNPQTLVGVTVGIFVACLGLGACAVAFWLASAIFLTRHYADIEPMLPAQLQQMFSAGMPDSTLYILWGVSIVAGIILVALVQALQLHFTTVTARGVPVSFRQTLRSSLTSVGALLGLAGLMLLAVVVLLVTIGMLSAVAPAIIFLLGAATIVAVIYGSVRLAFAGYGIVDKNLGPIATIQYSWRITDGRFVDILGVAALTSILFTVPSIIFGALAKVSEGIPGLVTTFDILNLVFQVALIVIAAMPLAERYVQSVAVHEKQIEAKPISPFNFLAIALVFILMPIYDALTVQTTEPTDPYDSFGVPSFEESIDPNTLQGSSRAY